MTGTKSAGKKSEYEVREHVDDDDNSWYSGGRTVVRGKERGKRNHILSFAFEISDTPDCCGINIIHGFNTSRVEYHVPEEVFVRVGQWLKRRLGGTPHSAFTNNEQQDEEKVLTAAGFEVVDEFRGNPGHGSRIKQWKYIPPSRRIKVKKKPSSVKQRVRSAPAKRATR